MTFVTFRFWRYVFLTPVLGAVGLGVLWALGFASFFITVIAMGPVQATLKTDGVVVLTGGAERVKTGLELLQHGQTRELLISGVHHAADLKDLLLKSHMNGADFPCCITLGFEASDTVGNARETADWVHSNKIQTLRLVTATYHMPRALIEMKRALPGVRLVAHPVRPASFSPWSNRGWILTLSEYHKTLLALARFSVDKLRTMM
jgi:uncharacterized SAM-binding protein YcdF (DUF218 family)